jgi:hypothetical protein
LGVNGAGTCNAKILSEAEGSAGSAVDGMEVEFCLKEWRALGDDLRTLALLNP